MTATGLIGAAGAVALPGERADIAVGGLSAPIGYFPREAFLR